ncbi:MAG: hypothetical protein EKK53_08095 [Burkholderiales bacterium]|nr:MAG: hypothetical protein EKK53_08095 [Burkholderiales bacterium]
MKLERAEALFATPLLVFRLEGAEALNAQLSSEALERRRNEPGLERSNRGGWHSADDFFRRSEPGAQALQHQVVQAITQATLHVSPRFPLSRYGLQVEGWININGQGAMNAPHDHPGWVWSGCYYVAVELDAGGALELLDHRTNIRTLTVDGADCFASKHRHQPQAGELVIFPSWLRHWVEPNLGKQDRISIALNARYVAHGS